MPRACFDKTRDAISCCHSYVKCLHPSADSKMHSVIVKRCLVMRFLVIFFFHMLGSCTKAKPSTWRTRMLFQSFPLLLEFYLPLFSTVLPSNSRLFLSCRPFVVITFSTGLADVEVTSVSTSTRPVENVITTKGLQDRNNLLLDGRTVENKGKLILTEIFPSVQKHDI